MGSYHAKLSPSSADRWTDCTASPDAQEGIPNENSDASRLGTVCHQMQEEILLGQAPHAESYLGSKMVFYYLAETEEHYVEWSEDVSELSWNLMGKPEATVEVTDDMVAAVTSAVDFIKEQHELLGGELLVEQRVPIGQFTGEEGASGSADVILVGDNWIHVMDSKFGRKRVSASRLVQRGGVDIITGAVTQDVLGPNLQMACYALGSAHKVDPTGERFNSVTMTIVQPYLDATDSYSCSMEELRETEEFLRAKAIETRENPQFKPSFSNCFFCRAAKNGSCESRNGLALSTVFEGFDDGERVCHVKRADPLTLGSQYALVEFVRGWADDIENAVRTALNNDEPVVRADGVGYKLIAGKAGARNWNDEAAVEASLHKMQVPDADMYSKKLVTPAALEKLCKAPKPKKGQPPTPPKVPSAVWAAVQNSIDQGETKPRIVLETDPHPALSKASGFEDVEEEPTFAELFGE